MGTAFTTKDDRRLTNDEGRTTKDHRRTTNDEGRTTKDHRRRTPTKVGRRRTTDERRRSDDEGRRAKDEDISAQILRIGLPKGSLQEATLGLFRRAGFV